MIKGVTQAIENETKEERGGFLDILLGILSAGLLGSMLTGKGMIRAGDGVQRARHGF